MAMKRSRFFVSVQFINVSGSRKNSYTKMITPFFPLADAFLSIVTGGAEARIELTKYSMYYGNVNIKE
ncbi:MAG: hypothetical protein Q8Q39_05830 [bacterium]|nr:hypothetical protein [bacterium]